MLRNVGYNFAAKLWFLVLAVMATPQLVHGLGSELFGLYTLIGSLAGYFSVLDLGLGIATVKYVAEYRGRRDDEAIGRTLTSAMAAYLLLGAVGALALGASAGVLVERVLGVPPGLEDTARTAVQMTALGLLVSMPLSMLNAIPVALQRMDIANRRNVLFGSVTVVGSVLLVAAGRGIVAVVGYGIAVNVVAMASFTVTARRLLPGVSLRPRFDVASLRRLGGFSALKFANQLATRTVAHLDKLLLAAFAPLAVVGHYVIALTLAQRLGGLVSNVAGAFLPAASEAHGWKDDEGFNDLYVRGTKLVGLFVLPVGVLLVVFAHPLLLHWVGSEVARESSGVLQVLAVAYVINAFSTMPAVACDSRSRPAVTTAFSVASAALNVLLALVLIPRFGALGAGLAVLVNSVLLVPLFLAYVHRRILRSSLGELVRRSILRPALAAALLVPAAWLLRMWVSSLLTLLAAIGTAVVLYGAISIAIGTYDAVDRAMVSGRLGRKRAPERGVVA